MPDTVDATLSESVLSSLRDLERDLRQLKLSEPKKGKRLTPLREAERFSLIHDILGHLDALARPIDEEKKRLEARLQEHMLDGDLPESFRAGGRSVHIARQVWASPIKGEDGKPDHDVLVQALHDLDLEEFLPSKVNGQSFSAFVREFVDPDDEMELHERLLSPNPKPLDPRLLAAISVSEKVQVKAPKS